MKTRHLETRECYSIYKKDETGLIPEETAVASVFYQKGKISRIDFLPKPTNDYTLVECEKSKQLLKRLNPPRTQKEMEQIVSLLESSLQDSQ